MSGIRSFFRQLGKLPNLETVQILASPPKMIPSSLLSIFLCDSESDSIPLTLIKNPVFSQLHSASRCASFPSVTNLVVPLDGHSFVWVFSDAKSVTVIPNLFGASNPDPGSSELLEHEQALPQQTEAEKIDQLFLDYYGLRFVTRMEYLKVSEEWDMLEILKGVLSLFLPWFSHDHWNGLGNRTIGKVT
jgi:hypothetical protein